MVLIIITSCYYHKHSTSYNVQCKWSIITQESGFCYDFTLNFAPLNSGPFQAVTLQRAHVLIQPHYIVCNLPSTNLIQIKCLAQAHKCLALDQTHDFAFSVMGLDLTLMMMMMMIQVCNTTTSTTSNNDNNSK